MPQRASRRAVEPSREQELTTGLWLRPDENRSSILVERPQGLVPLAAVVFEEHRALSMLAMLGGRRLLDVTVQPGALARVVSSEAVAARRAGNAWCSAIEAAVSRSASERGLWRRGDAAPRGLVPLLTGLGFWPSPARGPPLQRHSDRVQRARRRVHSRRVSSRRRALPPTLPSRSVPCVSP